MCDEGGTETYCTTTRRPSTSYSTPTENCVPSSCTLAQISSPKCKCAYPYAGDLVFRAPLFSSFGNTSLYELLHQKLMLAFVTGGLPVDSVSLSNPTKNIDDYLILNLQVFPSDQEYFNRTGISRIGFALSNQTFKPPHEFGPFYFSANSYEYFSGKLVNNIHKCEIWWKIQTYVFMWIFFPSFRIDHGVT